VCGAANGAHDRLRRRREQSTARRRRRAWLCLLLRPFRVPVPRVSAWVFSPPLALLPRGGSFGISWESRGRKRKRRVDGRDAIMRGGEEARGRGGPGNRLIIAVWGGSCCAVLAEAEAESGGELVFVCPRARGIHHLIILLALLNFD
jgi:hypothetical protein